MEEKTMKRIITIMLTIALVASMLAFVPDTASAKRQEMDAKVTGQLNSIKVKWKKIKKAKKYQIYRVSSKKYNTRTKKKGYKKIATIKKTKYIDKKVKKNKYYAYYIKAINKKGKVITNNFYDYPDFRCKGLEKPEFYNDNEVDVLCNHKKITLSISEGNMGFFPKSLKYEFYRKEVNEKSFKKINIKKDNDYWTDNNVVPLKTYTYKIRSYYKKGKKTYYSKFSGTKTIQAFDRKAEFDIESLTPSGTYKPGGLEIVLKIKKTSQYSSDVYVYRAAGSYEGCAKNKEEHMEENYFTMYMSDYSLDNSSWKQIGDNGLKLELGRTYYLKAYILSKSDKKIVYAGNDKTNYRISDFSAEDNVFKYCLKGNKHTNAEFDLLKGKGFVGCSE